MKMWSYTERRQQFITLLLLLLLFVFFQSKCDFIILVRVTLRVRIANPMVKGSCYRGGIVHIRFGSFLCASRTASSSHGALAVSCKYFKQSKWPFLAACAHAYFVDIYHTYAQQDIRVYEDDHFEPPMRQYDTSQGALDFFV